MWSYGPCEPIQRRPLIDKTIAAVALADCRNHENGERISVLIFPLIPCATIDYDTLEMLQAIGTNMGNFRPPEDIAKAIAVCELGSVQGGVLYTRQPKQMRRPCADHGGKVGR
jgi:hypothetical protein